MWEGKRYKATVIKKSSETKARKIREGVPQNNSTKFMCLNTGVIYNSVAQGAQDMKLKYSGLYLAVKGLRKQLKGYKFQMI